MTTSIGNTHYFSDKQLTLLVQQMAIQQLDAGSLLFFDGDRADKMYFVFEGKLKTTKSSSDGKTFVLHIYTTGDLFGQFETLPNETIGYSAEVIEPCKVGVMAQKDIEQLLWQYPELAYPFMKWSAAMQRITETKVRDLILYGKSGALCSTLIRLSHTFGKDFEDGSVLIQQKLTNSDLAEMIGATRESVNRILNAFRDLGVIEYDAGQIWIKKLNYLENMCHCESCPNEICRM
jgi:CRP/FNR family transcriptional regulator